MTGRTGAAMRPSEAFAASDRQLRILYVASRHPGGQSYGHIVVMRSLLSALEALGHDVELAVCCGPGEPHPSPWRGRPVHRIDWARPARAAARALLEVPCRRRSLNECLYDTRRGRSELRQLVDQLSPDVVVADTVRTVPLVEPLTVPLIVDLGDLLSLRYRQAPRGDAERRHVLGYYGDTLPAWLRPAAARLAMTALRAEASVLERREARAAKRADVTLLVSPEETATLTQRAGRPVCVRPVSVDIPPAPADPASAAPGTAVFVGRMDYGPNRRAVEWLVENVLPRLDSAPSPLQLRVIGHCPDDLRPPLMGAGVTVTGYVDDLAGELAANRMFIAPVVSGSGLNIKILDAMAAGLPVVGTRQSARGLHPDLRAAMLVNDRADGFAASMARLMQDPTLARNLGAAGRRAVVAHHGPDAVTQQWTTLLRSAFGRQGSDSADQASRR